MMTTKTMMIDHELFQTEQVAGQRVDFQLGHAVVSANPQEIIAVKFDAENEIAYQPIGF